MQAYSAPPACRCLSENQGVLSPSEATLATAHSRRKCHPEPKARDLLRGFAGVPSSPHDPRRRFLPSKTRVAMTLQRGRCYKSAAFGSLKGFCEADGRSSLQKIEINRATSTEIGTRIACLLNVRARKKALLFTKRH